MPGAHTLGPRLWTGRGATPPAESAAMPVPESAAESALARAPSGHALRPRTLIIPEGGSLAIECRWSAGT